MMGYLLSFGVVGAMVVIILVLLALKMIAKFLPFMKWVLTGILAALVVTFVLPAFGFPNPFDVLLEKIGINGIGVIRS